MLVLDLDKWGEKYQTSAPASFLDIDDAILHRNPMYITIIGIYALKVPISLYIQAILCNFQIPRTITTKYRLGWMVVATYYVSIGLNKWCEKYGTSAPARYARYWRWNSWLKSDVYYDNRHIYMPVNSLFHCIYNLYYAIFKYHER